MAPTAWSGGASSLQDRIQGWQESPLTRGQDESREASVGQSPAQTTFLLNPPWSAYRAEAGAAPQSGCSGHCSVRTAHCSPAPSIPMSLSVGCPLSQLLSLFNMYSPHVHVCLATPLRFCEAPTETKSLSILLVPAEPSSEGVESLRPEPANPFQTAG